jgi:hypothetical protein
MMRRVHPVNMHAAPKPIGRAHFNSVVSKAPLMGVPAKPAKAINVKANPIRIPISEILLARLANRGLINETSVKKELMSDINYLSDENDYLQAPLKRP